MRYDMTTPLRVTPLSSVTETSRNIVSIVNLSFETETGDCIPSETVEGMLLLPNQARVVRVAVNKTEART